MKIPERKQQLILMSIAVMCVLFVLLSYIPLSNAKKSIYQDRIRYGNEHAVVSSQVEVLPLITEEKTRLERYVGNYESKIPSERKFASLWEQITDLMKEHGLKEQLIQPGEQIEGEELICIPISIQCSGKPNQVFALFRSLESFERLMRIDKLELSRSQSDEGQIDAKAQACVYYRSE